MEYLNDLRRDGIIYLNQDYMIMLSLVPSVVLVKKLTALPGDDATKVLFGQIPFNLHITQRFPDLGSFH